MSEEQAIDYPSERKRIGRLNRAALHDKGGSFRRRLRVAFDTQAYQYCANERPKIVTSENCEGPWSGIPGSWRVETTNAIVDQPEELPFLYAICELSRSGDILLVELPIVRQERAAHQKAHGVFHGPERLDHGVSCAPYPIRCEKLKYATSFFLGSEDKNHCLADLYAYKKMFSHVTGKKQEGDVVALVQADLAAIDVFITLDSKFRRPFIQIEEKLREAGCETRVMSPGEFCAAAAIQPIPFPPSDPDQGAGKSPPLR